MNIKSYSNTGVSVTLSFVIVAAVFALLFTPGFFVSKAINRSQLTESKGLPNYDIRLDSKAADKIAEFRGRSGRTAATVADARDEFVRGESTLKQRVPNLKVVYNERLHAPEIIGPDPTQGSHAALVGQANSSRAETLRAFAKENAGLVGLSNSQADSLAA